MPINLSIEYPKLENERNKLRYQNDELVKALQAVSPLLDYCINATPTGDTRNLLTDANIKVKTALQNTIKN